MNRILSGTCSNPNPLNNGNVEGFTQELLSNGTYPVGTKASVNCGIGYNGNKSYDISCAEPGIWVPRPAVCIPNEDSK